MTGNKNQRKKIRLLICFGLSLVASVSCFSINSHRANFQEEGVQRLKNLGHSVYYDFQVDEDLRVKKGAFSPIPSFLIDWFGVDFFHSVEKVSDYDDLHDLLHFPHLNEISIPPNFRKRSLIRKFTNLKRLNLSPDVSFDVNLVSNPYSITELQCQIKDLRNLEAFESLTFLRVSTLSKNWERLTKLKKLKHLEVLSSSKDLGLDSFSHLKQIERYEFNADGFPI